MVNLIANMFPGSKLAECGGWFATQAFMVTLTAFVAILHLIFSTTHDMNVGFERVWLMLKEERLPWLRSCLYRHKLPHCRRIII